MRDNPLSTRVSTRMATPVLPQTQRAVCPTIMVVEDSEDIRFMMRTLLEMEGYQVIEAADGLQAIEMALNHRPSMIIMDLTLPRLDGLSATHRIREQLDNIPIVALSGHISDDHRSAAFAAGCTDYLVKPLDFELLYQVLARLSC